ncbi:MAG: DNA polymerase III subunit alpha [Spirochaetales bacterium]|nr:DNA polymerase III subunit alpha [Spirochaetales bacterium]
MKEFVHLHNHSDYSLLDGAVTIDGLIEMAKKYEMKHLALTDHGNLFGSLRFEQACRNAGINPIIGCEVYVAPGSRQDKDSNKRKYYHMILLCKNEKGYQNLTNLVSQAFIDGFYYKPRIDDELLEKYSEGLICTTACLAGEISQHILNDNYEKAKDRALYYRNLFGDDSYYLEIMNHELEDEIKVRDGMVKLSKETGIPLVATNDIHYQLKEHANAQDILICIGTNKKKSEAKRMQMHGSHLYFKSPDEMYELFKDYPEAIENTLKIAEMCNVSIPQPGPILPDYEIPSEFEDQKAYLQHITWEGVKKRYGEITPEVKERTEYELGILLGMGFEGYFLIVWDFIDWAKRNGISVGPGRGSGAGSIIAYAIGITDIDPLKYELLFERFLNPERISMPDFDVDFCFERRQEVINYVTEKYGRDQVGGICTFGTLKTKAVLKDVARVLDIPFAESNTISKLLPEGKTPDGRKINVPVALEITPELQEYYNRGGIYKELFDTAAILEGMNRHVSTHACGMVIGKTKLTDYVPLYKDQKSGAVSSEFTMDIIEPCGLVKMDFLGLKTLTLLSNTERLVQKHKPDFKVDEVPIDDKTTYKMLQEGKSSAVFQFESAGMQDILRRAKPDNIEDLIALNALYRPGPMQYIPQFIDSKTGKMEIQYPDPLLEETLKPTYGVIVYQEQVMKVAQIIGGFSLGKADILRRAMGKKKVKEMDKMKVEFVKGAKENGHTEEHASEIFDMLVPFAGYGFNKSHAAAYSVVAYKTAYCKANYPAEFMAANLTNEISNPTSFADYLAETKEMGIELAPPDINDSEKYFTVVDGKIVYGLTGMKGIGSAAVDSIISARESKGKFKNFEDFIEKVELRTVNSRVLEVLVTSGLFDKIEKHNRATIMHNAEKIINSVQKKQESTQFGQGSLFGDLEEQIFPEIIWEEIPEYPEKELLQMEKENIGFFFSGHPMDKFKDQWKRTVNLNLSNIKTASQDKIYSILGMIKNPKSITTKNGKRMAFADLEDYNGTIELVLFAKKFEQYGYLLQPDAVLGITGYVDTTRDKPSFKVEEIKDPAELKEIIAPEVHMEFHSEDMTEDELEGLRNFIMDNKGNSDVFFHIKRPNINKEFVIKISSQLTINGGDTTLIDLRRLPKIKNVWRE